MRLLSSEWSGKPSFSLFKATPPPYAILSHTWDHDEVSFEDLTSGSGKEKNGYRKIEFCADQARQDNLQYFWVDTCCIDKWNHLERSKAINSMFRWYQNAAKCYVILSDVSVPNAADIPRQNSWESSFKESKWFTRGWTLQELIAPSSVEFFSSEGYLLGNKRSLEPLIREITGLPAEALQNRALDEFSVSERMEWARNRNTTEPEDSVYCLLGILNVFMITSYDEGKENASNRLKDELDRINKTPFMVPFSRNNRFVGYESQLIELEGRVFANKQTTKIAIAGPAGIGKSQLALELAYRIRQRYNNCSIFWIPAGDMDSFRQACSYIAQKLDIPGWDDEKEDARELVQRHLSGKNAGQWLLIYDDADDAGDADLSVGGLSTLPAATLIDFMPQSQQGCIIFTTTVSHTAETLAPQNAIELQNMTAETAQRMLESHLTDLSFTSERHETKFLLEELSYLPLGIVQAAAYIELHKISTNDYLELLRQQKKTAKHNDTQFGKESQHNSSDNPVAKTWLISLDQISCHNSAAANCLFFMACIDRKDILLDLLPATSLSEKKAAVEILNKYALITKRPASSAAEVHRLVHLAVRNYLREQDLLDQWSRKAVVGLAENFPSTSHENRSKWRRLMPHAKFALAYRLTEEDDESTITLAWKYARALYEDGRYKEAEELFVAVTDARKIILGADHPDTLTSVANLASTFSNQGRWEEAEKLEVAVVETRKAQLGADHPDTLKSMSNLASTYRNQGRWEEAEKLGVVVMETRKTTLGADHTDTLTSMNNLTLTYRNLGRWEEAEKLGLVVMEMTKTKLGVDHPYTLSSMNNLAETLFNQGRWVEAEKLFLEVMETRKAKLGDDHPDTLTSVTNLAATICNQGRWEEAEKLEMAVMETSKIKLGPDHPDTLTTMANLASTLGKQDRWEEAKKLEVLVLETSKSKLGFDHPDTLMSMANLASTLWKQGQRDEAEKLFLAVMETRKSKFGADHPDTLMSMADLASTFWKQGRLEEAEKLDVAVTETRKAKLGADHPDTLSSMNNLAHTWKSLGRHEDALSLMIHCVETSQRALGPSHPTTHGFSATLEEWRR